jgi:hypothetical protein
MKRPIITESSRAWKRSGFGYSNRPDPIEDPFIAARATVRQIDFIELLANDLTFGRTKRNAEISNLLQRKIEYLDELTKSEASTVIIKFKERKEHRNSDMYP